MAKRKVNSRYYEELDARTDVHPSGRGYLMIPCPFHADEDPSCSVDLKDGSFRCFSGECRERGEFYKLIAELDGVSEEEAKSRFHYTPVSELVERAHKSAERMREKEDRVRSYYDIKSFNTVFPDVRKYTRAMNYLRGRGITEDTIHRFSIRWGARKGVFRHRVILPIFNVEGKLVSYTGRTVYDDVKPKTRKPRPVGRTFYGLHEILRDWTDEKLDVLVLVEGEFDAIYLQQHGIPAVAIMGTARMTLGHGYTLRRYTKRVVLSYDGDDAGVEAMSHDLNVIHGAIPCSRKFLPDGLDPATLSEQEIADIYGDLISV